MFENWDNELVLNNGMLFLRIHGCRQQYGYFQREGVQGEVEEGEGG